MEETVRIDALRAIEQMEGEEAALLLRLKASGGDLRAAVVGQALESLLKLEGIRALDFARTFLVEKDTQTPKELRSTADEVVEEAALALGNSRLPAAVDALKEVWTQQPKIIFLQAISTSRQESGFEFLLHLVATARERDAANALEVLSLHADSPEIRAAALAAVTTRGSADLRDKYQAKFGAS